MNTVKNLPKNVSELVESKWYGKIRTLIGNFRLREDPEDILSEIILLLIDKRYIERYHEEDHDVKGPAFATWLYTFCSNVCKRKYNRSNTRGGRLIEGAVSLSKPVDSEEKSELSSIISDKSRSRDTSEYAVLVSQVVELLDTHELRPRSSNTYKTKTVRIRNTEFDAFPDMEGKAFDRDAKTAFKLFSEGYDARDISILMGTSVQFVYLLRGQIQGVMTESGVL